MTTNTKNILILILGSYRAPLVLVMHVQILLTLKIQIHKTYWTPLKTWSMGHTYTNTTEELLQIPHWLHVQIHKHIATNTQNILLLRSGSYRTPFCPGPWSGMYKFLWYICTNTENMLNLSLGELHVQILLTLKIQIHKTLAIHMYKYRKHVKPWIGFLPNTLSPCPWVSCMYKYLRRYTCLIAQQNHSRSKVLCVPYPQPIFHQYLQLLLLTQKVLWLTTIPC